MGIWIRTALEPAVVKRAVKYALVVGVILVLINYLDILIVGTLARTIHETDGCSLAL